MKRRRMSLRTWMAFVLAWGVLLAWIRAQGSSGNAIVAIVGFVRFAAHVVAAAGLGITFSLTLTRGFGLSLGRPGWRRAVPSLLAFAIVALLYLAWSVQRCASFAAFVHPREFPFPDPWLYAMERWFDARHPLRVPGSLKLHGEIYRVLSVLAWASLAGLFVTGFLLGLLLERAKRTTPNAEPRRNSLRELTSSSVPSGGLDRQRWLTSVLARKSPRNRGGLGVPWLHRGHLWEAVGKCEATVPYSSRGPTSD